jgi:N utilization substance protein B
MSMQSRSLSRELALLVLGQCPERVGEPLDLSLDTLLQKGLDSLLQHWTEVLDCCAGDLEKAQQHLLDSELKDGPSSDHASVRLSLQASLSGAEQVLNGLSASLELPRLLALSNQDQVRRDAMQRVTFVLRKRKEIDQLLDGVMEGWRIARLPRIDRDILRLAVIEKNYKKKTNRE